METDKKICLIVLSLIALFFSLYKITESPPILYDEGWYFQTAANLATQGVDGLQLSPGSVTHISTMVTVGYPLIYPLALWFKIFSIGLLQARILMILFLLGFIALGTRLAWKTYGASAGLGTLAILATFPPLFGNGKSVMGEVPGLFFAVLMLVCLHNIVTDPQRKKLWIILAALLVGICIATKPFFLLLLPALALAGCVEWRRGSLQPRDFILAGIFLLIPIAVWVVVQFQAGDTFTDVISYYANPYNLGNLTEIIIGNIRRLFSDMGTLYTVFLMAVWVCSFVVRLRRKIKITSIEITALVFSVLIVLAYLRTSGAYRYLFPAQAVTIVFFPYSLLTLSEAISQHFSWRKFTRTYPLLISVLAFLGVYQLSFNSWVAEAYSSTKTQSLEAYFSAVPDSDLIFVYNVPEAVPFIRGRNYYQYLQLFVVNLGEDNLPVLKKGLPDRVVVPSALFEDDKKGLFNHYTKETVINRTSFLKKK